MSVQYTEHSRVLEVAADVTAPPHYSATGYGGKIPTRHRVKYRSGNVAFWHRVYAMVYGNSPSIYIRVGGEVLFLDLDTESDLMDRGAS